jgi:hypothetical protein
VTVIIEGGHIPIIMYLYTLYFGILYTSTNDFSKNSVFFSILGVFRESAKKNFARVLPSQYLTIL